MKNNLLQHKNSQLKPLKAVYSYYFTEVREIVGLARNIDSDLFAVTGDGQKAQDSINEVMRFDVPLVIPKTGEGYVDLDRIHEPVIDRVVSAYSPLVKGLKEFENRYPTAGTSEGIYHYLTNLAVHKTTYIYVLEGEYEGYSEYARMLGLEVRVVKDFAEAANLKEAGHWCISNPSARDGNIIANQDIVELAEIGHKIALDLAYVGATKPYEFDVSHPNVEAVFLSFSKPYGVFRFRIGFSFFRQPLESLYGTRWFKDIERVLTAAKLVEVLPPETLYEKYHSYQEKAIVMMNKQQGTQAQPSDVLLLATSNRAPKEFVTYKRGDLYRFCLTPYFEAIEKS